MVTHLLVGLKLKLITAPLYKGTSKIRPPPTKEHYNTKYIILGLNN